MLINRWSMLALLFAVRTGMGIQYQEVAALSPLYLHDFSLTLADLGVLIGLYHAPGTFLAYPGGAIGARFGDKRTVLLGLLLMIIGGLMMACVPAWSIQIIGRFVAGAGGILLNVLISKMVTDWFAGREMATAMAIIGNAAPFGIAMALVALPPLAGAGDRWPPAIAVIAYLVVAFAALALLYRVPAQTTPKTAARALRPDRRAIQALVAAGCVYGLYNAGLVTILGFGPLMLMERGWTMNAASSTTSLVLWLVAISLPAGGWLADRSGRSAWILLGGLLGFAAALVLASRIDAMMLAFVLLGIVSGLPCGAIMALPAQVLSPPTRAIGMGIFFTVYYALQIACPWLVGKVAESAGHASIALDTGALFLVIACGAWCLFRVLAAPQRQVAVR